MAKNLYLQSENTGTRGNIIRLLRRRQCTVEELAQKLGITDNAVRVHLGKLEKDGLVQQNELRRGQFKPSFLYELTSAADQLFPKAYSIVLNELLNILDEEMSIHEREIVLRKTGERLAKQLHISLDSDTSKRIDVAVQALNQLGGLTERADEENCYVIQGFSCPLSSTIQQHPDACILAESLLREIIGAPVQECCTHGQQPHCCFRISKN